MICQFQMLASTLLHPPSLVHSPSFMAVPLSSPTSATSLGSASLCHLSTSMVYYALSHTWVTMTDMKRSPWPPGPFKMQLDQRIFSGYHLDSLSILSNMLALLASRATSPSCLAALGHVLCLNHPQPLTRNHSRT